MIYFKLFLTFLEIGAVSFGGGYGIILLIAAVLSNLLKYAGVQAFLSGVRPCVVALILATALTMGLSTLFGFTTIRSAPEVDLRGVVILLLLIMLSGWCVYITSLMLSV